MADDSDSEGEIEDAKVTVPETHGDEMLSINSVMVIMIALFRFPVDVYFVS